MPVDRDFWLHYYFVLEGAPPYKCPTCNRGILRIVDGTLNEKQSGVSVREQSNPNWEAEWYLGRFACLLRCANDYCGEVVAVSGDSHVAPLGEDGDLVTVLSPRMFTPPLDIFSITRKCPNDVRLELREAFKLYWSDIPGGMNHIRKAVELIMDHLRVPRKKRTKVGKLRRLDLHSRISAFRARSPELADRLEAVKWLGNVGSHDSDITKEAFFDACDILEDVISTHFERHGSKIVALTKKVIKRKGKR